MIHISHDAQRTKRALMHFGDNIETIPGPFMLWTPTIVGLLTLKQTSTGSNLIVEKQL